MSGVESPWPEQLASHWSRILEAPAAGRCIATQPTDIEITQAPPGVREAVTGIVLDVVDPEAVRAAARDHGQPFEGDLPTVCGVSVELRAG